MVSSPKNPLYEVNIRWLKSYNQPDLFIYFVGLKAPCRRWRQRRRGGIKKCLKASWRRCYYPHRSRESQSHLNCITGFRVTAILLNVWILPIGGASAVVGLLSTGPTPSLLSHGLSNGLWKYLHNSVYPKLLELGSCNFETMFTTPCVSRVKCHVSCATCHMSHFMCHLWHDTCQVSQVIIYFFNYNLFELVGGGSVINGAYPV